MIYNTNHYTIAELFGKNGSVHYVIPKFQREYIWSRENWRVLFDDIVEGNGEGNFIGSILCVKNELPSSATMRELEVVDGQQRLATISLLLCALYATIQKHLTDDIGAADELLGAIKTRLLTEESERETRIVLSQQHGNDADYNALLVELGLRAIGEEQKGRKMRKIYKAYGYFFGTPKGV